MRFEAVMKKEKMKEYFDVRSPFEKLLERTCRQLSKEYKNYYTVTLTSPGGYRPGNSFQLIFGIEDVPKQAVPKLKKVFKEYIDHVVERKNHKHRWKLSGCDGVWVWLRCANCDAEQRISRTQYLTITRRLVLSNPNIFNLNTEEKRMINQFFQQYPDILRVAKQKLDKRREKLLRQNPKSPKISKLEREIETIHLFALIYKR